VAFQGTNEFPITQFRGSAQSVDPYELDQAHGLYSQNVDFIVSPDGNTVQAGSRLGISQVAQIPSSDGAVTSLASWYYGLNGVPQCWALYYAPNVGLKGYYQSTAAFSSTMVSVTGAAYASMAFDGIKAIVAFGDATGRDGNAAGGYIVDGGLTLIDKLFAPPLSTSNITVTVNTTASAGVVTAGTHRIGIVCTTRNGYTGPLSPVNSSNVFQPVSAAAPDGVHSWSVTVTVSGSLPSYMTGGPSIMQVVMTTAANPARYYAVPGATAAIGSTSITVSISDGDLAATGTDLTESQNLTTQTQSGTPPFLPYAVFTYSNRMGYCTTDGSGFPVLYFSDQNNYQSLNAAFYGIYLEGRQIPITGASLGQVCYIATLTALYMTQDNGDLPGTWTPPARVDGSVGVLAPQNLLAAGGKLIVASQKGLFIYRGGAFPVIPNSYWQSPDWNRINWSAPTQVQVADDSLNRVLRVFAPLKVQVTAASNTNPIIITTGILIGNRVLPYPHLFQTGLSVTISGVGGNTNANTTAAVTVLSASTFSIPVAGNGSYTSGGIVNPNAPNAEMSWNYSTGEGPGSMLYSLNAFAGYRGGAMASIFNIGTNEEEIWYAPSNSNPGCLVRRVLSTDTLPHRDVDLSGAASAISNQYETGLTPGPDPEATVHDFHGMHYRATGTGNLAVVAYGIDHVYSTVPALSPAALSQTPGLEYLMKWWLRSEQQTIQFGTNAVDAYFVLAMIKAYWTPSLPFR
jgi:hypothetical protein